MSELKKCPSCRGEAEPARQSNTDEYFVTCIKCWHSTGFCNSEEEAIKQWNSRPLEDALQAKVDKMTDVVEAAIAVVKGRELITTNPNSSYTEFRKIDADFVKKVKAMEK